MRHPFEEPSVRAVLRWDLERDQHSSLCECRAKRGSSAHDSQGHANALRKVSPVGLPLGTVRFTIRPAPAEKYGLRYQHPCDVDMKCISTTHLSAIIFCQNVSAAPGAPGRLVSACDRAFWPLILTSSPDVLGGTTVSAEELEPAAGAGLGRNMPSSLVYEYANPSTTSKGHSEHHSIRNLDSAGNSLAIMARIYGTV